MDSRTEDNAKFNLDFAMNQADYFNDGRDLTGDQASIVSLGHEVKRLRAKLNVIAFPRRGSPEAGWGVEEIGRFAAEGPEPEPAWFYKDESPVPQMDAKGRVLVSPAAQQEAFVAGSARMAFKMTTPMHASELIDEARGEARRRYPDMVGEERREDEESSKRADDLANAFANGAFFMATHPDCTTGQVFSEANRRYSRES